MKVAVADTHQSDPLVWIAAGSVALMLHLYVFAQGLAAFQTAIDTPPLPRPTETRIIAAALSVAGDPTAPEPAPVLLEPETPAPASAEALSPETPEAETIAPVRSDIASVTTERLASVAEPTAPALAETDAPERITGTTPAPVTQTPERITGTTPSLPVPEPSAPSEPERVAGIAAPVSEPPPQPAPVAVPEPEAVEGVEAIAPATPERERIAETVEPVAETPPEEVAALTQQEPDRIAPVEDTPQASPPTSGEETAGIASANAPVQTAEEAEATYRDVLDVLRAYPVVDCFAALPGLSESNEFHLETFANDPGDLAAFRTALGSETEQLPGTIMKPVSQAQCDALPFITKSPRYPEFQLYFDLSTRDITSGTTLQGRIGNLTGGFVSLMLIDDEGIVQDLGSFLTFRPGAAEFSIPMTLQGSPVETQQLLMALSTRTRLQTLKGLSGQSARDVFNQLALEIAMQGGGEDIALVAFSVR